MNHADHEWAKEQIPAHLAGGLSAEERARLEAHAGSCAECIAELDAARRFDRQMEDLFSAVRPKAGLEERVIRSLRTVPAAPGRTRTSRALLVAAAVVLLGVLGFVIIQADTTETVAGAAPPAQARPEAPVSEMANQARPGVDRAGGEKGRVYTRVDDASGAVPRTWAEDLADAPQLEVKSRTEGGRELLASADELARRNEPALQFPGGATAASSVVDFFSAKSPERRSPAEKETVPAFVMLPPPAPSAAPADRGERAKGEGMVYGLNRTVEQQQQHLSFRDERRAAIGKADPGYFKPGDAVTELAATLQAGSVPEALKGGSGGAGKTVKLVSDKQGGEEPRRKFVSALPQEAAGTPKSQGPESQEPQTYQRKIIRTGEIEYEIESFDASVATIAKLVDEEKGFVATMNSDKLPNGKVRGTVVLRVPPERLDTLLLKLRGLGELKSQNIHSQDVGKQYYDLESRLRAARTMEERLLRIIKEGKGEIKDLLLAERELGEWRTKIEGYEGEKRYYDSQISLSTLTITLTEKEIRAPFAVIQTERVNLGLEVEDVEKAHKDAVAAVNEAKGRITKSDLKQLAAGQYSATLHFEVAPAAAGPLRDRFKQLGTVARLDIDRVEETEGGSGRASEILKVHQKDTQFFVSIYNLANIAPRETVVLSLACTDPEASYKAILARVSKAAGRVVTSSLNRQKNDQTTGEIRFEVKSAEAEAVLSDVRASGEVIRLDVAENPDTQNVTKSKQGFQVQLLAMGLVEPRETTTLQLASKDVAEAYRKLGEALAFAEARILAAQLNENDRQNVTATISFEVRRDQLPKVEGALAGAGEVMNRNVARAQDVERVVDSKKRFTLTLVNVASIRPRETLTLAVEAEAVDSAVAALEKAVSELGGRTVDSRHTRGVAGRDVSRLTIDLPLAKVSGATDRIKALGVLRVFDATRNPQAPEGELAIARLEVTLSTPQQLVDADSGPWARIKSGLSVGLTALSWSLTLVIVGLCFVLPVGLMAWGGLKIYRKARAKAA